MSERKNPLEWLDEKHEKTELLFRVWIENDYWKHIWLAWELDRQYPRDFTDILESFFMRCMAIDFEFRVFDVHLIPDFLCFVGIRCTAPNLIFFALRIRYFDNIVSVSVFSPQGYRPETEYSISYTKKYNEDNVHCDAFLKAQNQTRVLLELVSRENADLVHRYNQKHRLLARYTIYLWNTTLNLLRNRNLQHYLPAHLGVEVFCADWMIPYDKIAAIISPFESVLDCSFATGEMLYWLTISPDAFVQVQSQVAPPDYIEQLLLHELAHLTFDREHQNIGHGPAFQQRANVFGVRKSPGKDIVD